MGRGVARLGGIRHSDLRACLLTHTPGEDCSEFPGGRKAGRRAGRRTASKAGPSPGWQSHQALKRALEARKPAKKSPAKKRAAGGAAEVAYDRDSGPSSTYFLSIAELMR